MTTHISVLPLPSGFEQHLSVAAEPHQVTPKFRFYRESIRLCGILEDILSKVYQPWMNRTAPDLSLIAGGNTSSYYSLDTIVGLHKKLSDFENSIHETLSWKRNVDGQSENKVLFNDQKHLLHARYGFCYYIFFFFSNPYSGMLMTKQLHISPDHAPSAHSHTAINT